MRPIRGGVAELSLDSLESEPSDQLAIGMTFFAIREADGYRRGIPNPYLPWKATDGLLRDIREIRACVD